MSNATEPALSNAVTTGLSNVVTTEPAVFVVVFSIVTTITILSYFCGCCSRLSTALSRRALPAVDGRSVVRVGGLDESVLITFPQLTYAQALLEDKPVGVAAAAAAANSVNISSCCSICLTDYMGSDMLRLLPGCRHLFHVECIDPWLKLHASCPICRTSLLPAPVEEVHD